MSNNQNRPGGNQQQPPTDGPSAQQLSDRPADNPPAGDRPIQGRGRPNLEPFEIEFGDDYLRNQTIGSPPFQMIVRGTFSIARLGKRDVGMRDVGMVATKIPELPGHHLAVNIQGRRAVVFDPLAENADGSPNKKGMDALERYNNTARTNPGL